jgi:single-stranded-DNA-specific exonuclease
MVALGNGSGQGSGRSIPGFHLARALESCAAHLIAYGGHEMAAGLKIDPARVEDFRREFCRVADSLVTDQMLIPQLRLECVADLSQVTEALVNDLQRLGPFGHGNRRPLLCIDNAVVARPARRVGKTGDHLQLLVNQNRRTVRCIAFGAGDLIDRLAPGTSVRLAVEPSINEFNGRRNVELAIRDFQLASEPATEIG